ncbi:MAG: 30S ribosome-binding factor RbfA [Verrucomicrobiales bacterium]|jgi:ribosome-binding factor A|nr:30S ribosome-binding factor RbfA [Verrucomicrobiales bacterium]
MSQRISRVNELLKREISSCIEKNFEFPEILVTIHDVKVAQDLRTAQIFIGVIGSAEQKAKVLQKLNAKHGFIQNMVMKRVVLRNTPRFSFESDDSVERGVRVLNILEEIGEIELPEEPEADGRKPRL